MPTLDTKKRCKINDPNFHLKKLQKEEQIKFNEEKHKSKNENN